MSDQATALVFEHMATLLKVQGELLTNALGQLAAAARPAPAPDPLAQIRDLIGVVKDMAPPPAAPAAAAPTAQLPEGSPAWLYALDRAEAIVDKIMSRRALAAAPSAPGPTGSEPPLPPAIERLIRDVCQAADAGEAPDRHAESLAAQLSPEDVGILAPLFVGELSSGFPSNFIGAVPALHQRRAWVGPFLHAFRGAVTWPEKAEVASENNGREPEGATPGPPRKKRSRARPSEG